MIMDNELPKISAKQNKFLQEYIKNGNNATEAYRVAYNSLGKTVTCCIEASRLLKNPKLSLWLEYYNKKIKEEVKQELKYSALQAFQEFDDMKIIALEKKDKSGLSDPNVSAANKAIEMKCKLAGLLKDDATINNAVYVDMPAVEIDGDEFQLKIGDDIQQDD